MNRYLKFSEEVARAREEGRALVALESTIITHGMPYPRNVETARAVEAEIRALGAVPATIALLDGFIHIGLSDEELERLGQSSDAIKASRRDLGAILARRQTGSTTVAATMICAALAGISVFVTGGIGGVHRGVGESWDISADLEELAQSPVAVVCAGAKAILDLPKTLEYLETRGVPVMALGTDQLPAFFSRSSGLRAPLRVEDEGEAAAIIDSHWALGLSSGLLLTVPVPEADALPEADCAAFIAQALQEADSKGVSGKDITPFLLSRLVELSDGRTLTANISLIRNNARAGARLALSLSSKRPVSCQ